MPEFTSNAEWPEHVYTNIDGNHVSSDIHGSRQDASDVCTMLERYGFGGMKEDFPLRTWVEGPDDPVETYKVVGDHPIGQRPDKRFTGPYERSSSEAMLYASTLKKAGYENVKVEKIWPRS